jgi:outer membrane protein, heavy metal efflux system
MERNHPRYLFGSALLVAILGGCSTSPLDFSNRSQVDERSMMMPQGIDDWSHRQVDDPDLPVLDESAGLGDYLRYAALRNAGLEAQFQAWRAAIERVPQVRVLPDPRFTYGYYLGEVETRVGATQHMVSLSQTFPWFGKLQDREDAAARNAMAVYQRFEAARLALNLRVEQAYNELFYLERSIEITKDNLELLEQFERVAQARYQVAAAGHPDVIRVQVEFGKLEDRLRQQRDLREPLVARLNAALNRPVETRIPSITGVAQRESLATIEELFRVLQEQNPELRALAEEIERERIGAEIARKDGKPDLTVGVAYTAIAERSGLSIAENGDDSVLATFSINLPIWREKYDAKVREAVAKRLAVTSRRAEVSNRLSSELRRAIFDHHDARRRVDLFSNTLIPKATESLEASLSGFTQGATDFFDLIDAERTLLEFQLGLERARVDRATSYAHIEQLIGTVLVDVESKPETEGATP